MQKVATRMLGAQWDGRNTEVSVWAPACEAVLLRRNGRDIEMQRGADGVYSLRTDLRPGDRYQLVPLGKNNPNGLAVPDPVSRLLPEGVHGTTEIVDPNPFHWTNEGWRGIPLSDYIIYEFHTSTFSAQGTFDGVAEHFHHLKRLGITVIELMPVAAFPGTRNWGYDGVSPYAVQASYGGPEGLKRLVNAAHDAGLAVSLDVVYNHLGPEGNYLRLFGPYFTDRHKTPWGDGLNFDGPGCEGVRRYFVENALYWIREYHIDSLRLDATQQIMDDSPRHLLAEIAEEVHALARSLGRTVTVIAENDTNDARLVRTREQGGMGLDGMWSDDFHHTVHTALTGENKGYYTDFAGKREQIVRALNYGFVFQGEHFSHWGRPRGTKPDGIPLPAHVICIQNHDQVGNRALGERLSHLVPNGAAKMAAAMMLLAPHTPLIWMGEEFASSSPFQFFTDFGDPAMKKAVSEGRRAEFAEFEWDEFPDPQDPRTFERSRLKWEEAADHSEMLFWYRSLIALRKRLVTHGERTCHAELRGDSIVLEVPAGIPNLRAIFEFPDGARFEDPACWTRVLASDEDGYRVEVYERPPSDGGCDPTGAID